MAGENYPELGEAAWAWVTGQAGARWRFTEHRQDPPLLPPGTPWMQGAAGIAGSLRRLARVTRDGLTAPVDAPAVAVESF